jgi:hypothetical protein
MNNKLKNIRINSKLEKEVSALCEILHTNFSHKTKELLFQWKTEEERKLKKDNPELYEEYLNKLK